MAHTNFPANIPYKKIVWQRDTWSVARDAMFVKRFIGKGPNSVIQRITDLSKTEKGEGVVMQLVADLVEDGVINDDQREGKEEALQNFAQEILIGLISHQVRNKGKLSDQKTILRFRELARDRLGYWLANRVDQLAILSLSGVSYAYNNDGSTRVGSPFPNLLFNPKPLTDKRHLMWDGSQLLPSDTSEIDDTFVPSYKMIVKAISYAKTHYVKPLMDGGKEYYVLLMRPEAVAQLKMDPDYQRAVVHGMPRSKDGPWFTGATVTVDGAVIHEHRLTYNTTGASAGNKWGEDGTVNGTRSLLMGAQALGMADLGPPDWVEKRFDYDTKQGISVDKFIGFLNPEFYSIYDKSVQSFGVIGIDHYLDA